MAERTTLDVTNMYKIPIDVYDQMQPFSLDAGSTLIKLIYKDKNDGPIKDEDKVFGLLRCKSFAKVEIHDIVVYIKKHCNLDHIKAFEPLTVVGISCFLYMKYLEEELNIKFELQNETKAQNRGFMSVGKYISLQNFVAQFEETEEQEAIKKYQSFYKAVMTEETTYEGSKAWLNEDLQYPVMVAMLGTAFLVWKLDSDGRATDHELYRPGGAPFQAIYPILTGAQTFDEFVALAATGDCAKGSSTMASLPQPKLPDDPSYSAIFEDYNAQGLIVHFANQQNLQDANKADIAAMLLDMWLGGLMTYVAARARENHCPTVMFSGSFVQSDFMQKKMTNICTSMNVGWMMQHKRAPLKYFVVKNPGFLGAYGAMVWKFFPDHKDDDIIPVIFM